MSPSTKWWQQLCRIILVQKVLQVWKINFNWRFQEVPQRAYARAHCSRQQSKSTQPPPGIRATWGDISRRKTSLELFQIFGTLAERGRERKRTWTHQLLPLLELHAPSNGQPASQVQTDPTVVPHASNSGLRLERERGLNYCLLTKLFFNRHNFNSYQFSTA